MSRESIEYAHLREKVAVDSKDSHARMAFHDASPQRMLCLVAYDDDRIFIIFDAIAKMVDDSTDFAHPGGDDDDHGAGSFVELFGFIARIHEREHVATKRVSVLVVEGDGFRIETLAMPSKNLGEVMGER